MTGACLCSVAFASSVCFYSVWRCFSQSSFILFLLFLNVRIIILSRTHLCRQNLPARDASPQDFSSLQTKSPRQGCIDPGFFIPADRIFSSGMHRPGIFHPCRQNLPVRDALPPQLYPRFPSAPAVRRARLNSPQRLPGTPDKADSSDFQTAGFRSR